MTGGGGGSGRGCDKVIVLKMQEKNKMGEGVQWGGGGWLVAGLG